MRRYPLRPTNGPPVRFTLQNARGGWSWNGDYAILGDYDRDVTPLRLRSCNPVFLSNRTGATLYVWVNYAFADSIGSPSLYTLVDGAQLELSVDGQLFIQSVYVTSDIEGTGGNLQIWGWPR